MPFKCLILAIIAIISTIVSVPLAKRIAIRFDAIDYPTGRRVNSAPTPRMGGIAVFCGMAVSLLFMFILIKAGVWESPFTDHPVLKVDWTVAAIGVTAMFIVGIIDDVRNLKPIEKLAGQIVSACIIASSGCLLVSIGNPFNMSYIELGWLAYPITVIYIVIFANIINLIDGLDGLASSITIVASASIMFFAATSMRSDTLVLGSVLVGACLGFLKYNHHPASIFLGDSGSLLLGTMLGVLSLAAIARSTLLTSLLIPFLAAGVPLIDTCSAIIRRKRGHQSIGHADRCHIHHKLLDSGYSQSKVVAIMVVWTSMLAIGGIAVTLLHSWLRYAIFAVMVIISLIIVLKLGVLKPALEHRYSPRLSKRHVDDGTFSEEEFEKARLKTNKTDSAVKADDE